MHTESVNTRPGGVSLHVRISSYIRRNLVGFLALVVALSGTAFAASHIGARDIADNAVRSRHIKNGEVGEADLSRRTLSALKDSCPSTMRRYGTSLCIDRQPRGQATTYYAALSRCAAAGLRLPTQGEAWMARGLLSSTMEDSFWTDLSYRENPGGGSIVDVAVVIESGDTQPPIAFRPHSMAAQIYVRCAQPPTDA